MKILADICTGRVTHLRESEAMERSRRHALVMLGLAPATAAIVSTESFALPVEKKGQTRTGCSTNARVVVALRNLADAIEAGEVIVSDIAVNSKMSSVEILQNELVVNFIYTPGPEVS